MKWPKHRAGELFDIQLGKMLSEKARTGQMFPYLANFNVRWGKFDLTELNQMAFSSKEQKKFSIQQNDLLMCEGGEIGRCAVWVGSNTPIYYQKALHRLRPLDGRVNPYFMYYFMQHISTKGDLPKLVGETSIAHLTREKLLGLRIPVPPRDIQNNIVEVLLTWDRALEKTERLIAAKEKRFAALTQKLISQPCAKATGRWPVKHLGDVFSERVEANRADLPLLSITREEGIIPHGDSGRKDNSNEDKSKYLRVCPGDIAYNTMRMWQGVSALSKYEGIVSPAYTVCIPSNELFGDFVAHYFKTPWMIHQFYRYSQGLTSDTWNLKFKHFREIKASIPPMDKQMAIAEVLNTSRVEIELLKTQEEYFRAQKRGLMQKLLTGERPTSIAKEEVYG